MLAACFIVSTSFCSSCSRLTLYVRRKSATGKGQRDDALGLCSPVGDVDGPFCGSDSESCLLQSGLSSSSRIFGLSFARLCSNNSASKSRYRHSKRSAGTPERREELDEHHVELYLEPP